MVVWTIGKRVDMMVEVMVVPMVDSSDSVRVSCSADASADCKALQRDDPLEIPKNCLLEYR
jgi:hypothetical protein